MPPATFAVAAHFAVPIIRIVIGTRKQFASTRSLDDCDRAVAPHLCALSVVRHEKMQLLTRVGIRHRKERRIRLVEIGLIERDLRGILRIRLLQPVAFQRAPVLGVDALVLPQKRIKQTGAEKVRPVDNDAIAVATQRSTNSREAEQLLRCELETGHLQQPPGLLLEIMPARKNFARPGGKYRLAPPIVLHPTQAFGADNAGAEIRSR